MNLPLPFDFDPTTVDFETAFSRLEEILSSLNTGTISLDQSLRLYEEADLLIRTCSTRLNEAERRIEILIKNRQGELILGEQNKPQTQEYKISS